MALKLLIIHADDLFRRNLMERMLLEGFTVFEASPEAEAVDIFGKSNFDVVLLGAVGTHPKRLELLKSIKDIRPFTEVILLTAMEDHSLYASIQAMQSGAFDDLLVPLDIKALLSRIQEAYKRKKEKVKARRSTITEGRDSNNGKPGTECKNPTRIKESGK
jgi:DNA-binding NtrC family response regulator